MVRRRFPVPKTCGFEVSVRFQVAVVEKPSVNIENSPVSVDHCNDVNFLHCTGSSRQQGLNQLINNMKMQCCGHV